MKKLISLAITAVLCCSTLSYANLTDYQNAKEFAKKGPIKFPGGHKVAGAAVVAGSVVAGAAVMPLALADISGATPVGVTIGTLHGVKAGVSVFKGEYKKDNGDSNNVRTNISYKGASKVAKVFGQALDLENHRQDYLGEVAREIDVSRYSLKKYLANNFIGVYDYEGFVRTLHRNTSIIEANVSYSSSSTHSSSKNNEFCQNKLMGNLSLSNSQNEILEKIMLETWEAGDDADIRRLVSHLTRYNCNYQTKDEKLSSLMVLASLEVEGAGRAIRTVKGFGADSKIKDDKWRTALHWAAFSGNIEATKELVKVKDILFLTNREGRTALQVALKEGNTEVAKIIIEASR